MNVSKKVVSSLGVLCSCNKASQDLCAKQGTNKVNMEPNLTTKELRHIGVQ